MHSRLTNTESETNTESDELLEQMESLSDLTVTLRAELDQKLVPFAELMELEVGSLLPFSRPTGENIDIYAEEVLIGWGEILLADDVLTVRVASVRDTRMAVMEEVAESG